MSERQTSNADTKNSHFSEITISDYRILKGLTVNNLSKINLIAGANNTGKTSFLEAIGLLIGQNDVNNVVKIYNKRGKFFNKIPNKWLQNELQNIIINVNGIFKNFNVEVKIRGYQEEEESFNKASYLFSLEFSLKTLRIGNSRFFSNKAPGAYFKKFYRLCNYHLFSQNIISEVEKSLAFKSAVKNDLHEQIIEFIRQHIDKDIKAIMYFESDQQFIVKPSTLDIKSYGEGLQKIYFLALQFAYAKDGVLLIDELENGIHVDLLSKFIALIFKLSEEFNVQVFFTTHSKECIETFVKVAENEGKLSEVSSYALLNTNNKIEVDYISGEELSQLIESHGFDLRRVGKL